MKTLTVILPVFNEEGNLPELIRRLDQVRQQACSQVILRVLAVENGSEDKSLDTLRQLAGSYNFLDILVLDQNVGMDGALLAGINYCDADGVVTMQSDLEDPPEVISEMLKPWLSGCDNVRTINEAIPENSLRGFMSRVWYALLSASSSSGKLKNASDFQLIDRSIYERLRTVRLELVFFRNLPSELASSVCFVPYRRQKRVEGTSKFKLTSGVVFGLRALTLQTLNLRPIVLFLTLTLVLGLSALAVFTTLQVLLLGVPFDGYGVLVAILILGLTLQTAIGLTLISLVLRMIKALRMVRPYQVSSASDLQDRQE